MWTKLQVGEFKCVDDGKARGLIMSVGLRSFVTLIFDESIPHKQTDELRAMLSKMKFREVIVEIPSPRSGQADMTGV